MEIKDSGERTRFDTGAVRDMHTGKGRMDLLPWEALVEVSKHCEEGALKLKRKKVYIRNIIREVSKDVFHLFYLFQPIDITGIFTRTDA